MDRIKAVSPFRGGFAMDGVNAFSVYCLLPYALRVLRGGDDAAALQRLPRGAAPISSRTSVSTSASAGRSSVRCTCD